MQMGCWHVLDGCVMRLCGSSWKGSMQACVCRCCTHLDDEGCVHIPPPRLQALCQASQLINVEQELRRVGAKVENRAMRSSFRRGGARMGRH